ncbi:hypothetical protein JCM30471_09670 [Desulfuromonas carbonis]|uniref:DUF4398 domain-containing protein n=1 Tax=Desulfuromonas sp. DDH964 TaxID=1823759 RepID=UPI00078E17C9|nr:DUF4398 domain-containing protein [Desulfuromonas sp. DDH964]AMV72452.1 hypothetical protein DBW_2110 [Desulfuromonas sp. DDH964]
MKKLSFLLIGLTLAFTLTACGKQPVEEINSTRSAIDAAVSEGAEKYTADDLKAVNDKLAVVMDEIKVQDGKLFKNYDKAKQMLTALKVDADSLKAKVITVKEEQRAAAVAALDSASSSITEAEALLASAPQGKGSAADIAMMKGDLQGLQTALGEVQPLIDSGDYAAASERAASIQEKAGTIAAEVRAAQERLAALKIRRK